MSRLWLAAALVTSALTYLMAGPAVIDVAAADELKMTPAPQAAADRPTRGMSMERVEAKFGAPAKRVPAVGAPPITRWEYPGFVVYFEHHLVLHSVATI
jgi:hypothetical protein